MSDAWEKLCFDLTWLNVLTAYLFGMWNHPDVIY